MNGATTTARRDEEVPLSHTHTTGTQTNAVPLKTLQKQKGERDAVRQQVKEKPSSLLIIKVKVSASFSPGHCLTRKPNFHLLHSLHVIVSLRLTSLSLTLATDTVGLLIM